MIQILIFILITLSSCATSKVDCMEWNNRDKADCRNAFLPGDGE